MVIQALLIVVGFVLLIKGADWMVEGASALAKKYKVSDMVIGLTIVAFGTSAPELVVNSVASLQHHSDIVFGNVLGSNIANLFLILGIVGVIYPITVPSSTVWKEIPIAVFVLVLLYFLANSFSPQQISFLTRIDGIVLLLVFCVFMFYVFSQMKANKEEPEPIQLKHLPAWKITGLIVFGLAGLIAGGKLVVDNAVALAVAIGISEKIAGLTIVAIGTSLPELVTSVVAATKNKSDIAFGNIIGSNIFNVLLILSVSAIINPVVYNTSFNTELLLLIAGTLILFIAMFTGGRRKLDRPEAIVLLLIYIAYTSWLISREI